MDAGRSITTSSSNVASSDALEQRLTCSVCLQLYRDPRLLPCGHTFCQHCLAAYLTGGQTPAPRGQQGFHCPLCREFIPAPDRKTPPQQWATKFRPNFLIRDIVEVHGRAKSQSVLRPPCPRHPGKLLDLYCRDCQTCVCDRCVALEHRRCLEVQELGDAARETQHSARRHQQTVLRLLKQLEAKKKRCLAGKRELERIERDIDIKIEREGQELLRKVSDFLRTRKEALKRQARAHCRQCISVVTTYTEKCDELSGELRAIERALSSRLRPDRPPTNVQDEEKLSAVVSGLEQDAQQLASPCLFTVRLIMDDTVLTSILAGLKLGEVQTGTLRNFGSLGGEASTSTTSLPSIPLSSFSSSSSSSVSAARSARRPLSGYFQRRTPTAGSERQRPASLPSATTPRHCSCHPAGSGLASSPVDPRPASAASSVFSRSLNGPSSPPAAAVPYAGGALPASPGQGDRPSSPFQRPAATSSPIPSPLPLTQSAWLGQSSSSFFAQRDKAVRKARSAAVVGTERANGGGGGGEDVSRKGGGGRNGKPSKSLPPPPPLPPPRQPDKSVTQPPDEVAKEDAVERTPVRRKLSQP